MILYTRVTAEAAGHSQQLSRWNLTRFVYPKPITYYLLNNSLNVTTPALAATVDYRREHMTMSRVWAASRRTLTTRTHRTTEPPSFARPTPQSLPSNWTVGLRSMALTRQLLNQRWPHTYSPQDHYLSVSTLKIGVTM